MRRLDLPAEQINSPNPVDREKVRKLVKSLREKGWNDRPLLVRAYGKEYTALTGAHRLEAANILGVDVPVLVVEEEDLENGPKLGEEADWEDILNFLNRPGLNEAAEILEREEHFRENSYVTFLRRELRL